jgi:AAA family ATP:ADP antiporter
VRARINLQDAVDAQIRIAPVSRPAAPYLPRLLSRLASVEAHETSTVVAAFCLFFCMWAGFFAVRPVRETIGTVLGREQVANLWIATWVAALSIIPLYGAIVARFRRRVFLPCSYGVVALVLVGVGLALRESPIDPWIGRAFYVFISVVNLLLLSMFWSFLLELFSRHQVKRLSGVIWAGGSLGALIGPLLSDVLVGWIGSSGVMFVGAAWFIAAIFCQRVLLAMRGKPVDGHDAAVVDDRPVGGGLFAGVTLILRSPYLLGIALFVVLISAVSTLLYFEQLQLMKAAYPDVDDRTRMFARLDWIVQGLTLLSQIFLTGRIAARFGVTALLVCVPLLMVPGFLWLAGHATLLGVAIVFVLRRTCEYAFIRPGREMLWSALDLETKYKAKSTVDVAVYRGADALTAQLANGLATAGFGTAVVAMLGAGVAALWALNGWWLGRRFEAQAEVRDK